MGRHGHLCGRPTVPHTSSCLESLAHRLKGALRLAILHMERLRSAGTERYGLCSRSPARLMAGAVLCQAYHDLAPEHAPLLAVIFRLAGIHGLLSNGMARIGPSRPCRTYP